MYSILNPYKIDILNFAEKIYEYEFQINREFFVALEQDIVEQGELSVKLILDRSANMIKADFIIQGVVELTCDRSLKKFMHNVASTDTLLYKFSDRDEEFSDTVIFIKENTQTIDFSIPIFECIILKLPSKKIHPDYITEDDAISEDNILIYSTLNNEVIPSEKEADSIDPRWAALKKLKDTL